MTPDRRFSVAPMMGYTDRHMRFLMRLMTKRTFLYTEMIHARAVIGDARARATCFNQCERPLALQIAGCEPAELAEAAAIGADAGFDEINLNIGCPSPRAGAGRFGAALMAHPDDVARGVAAICAAVSIPVSVKCRLGIDAQDPHTTLPRFIAQMRDAGAAACIIHARKAWLDGVNPKANRTLPPLDHALVHEMKARFPEMAILINGGITSLNEAAEHLTRVDGVMLGRAVCRDPYILADADARLFGAAHAPIARAEVIRRFLAYARREAADGVALHLMLRHVSPLIKGWRGAKHARARLAQKDTRVLSALLAQAA